MRRKYDGANKVARIFMNSLRDRMNHKLIDKELAKMERITFSDKRQMDADYLEEAQCLMTAEELYAHEQSQDNRYTDMSAEEMEEMMSELDQLGRQFD